jgi:rhamnogalacturonan endolyase
VHETEAAHQGKGGTLRDAATGAVLAFAPGTGDVGRGCAFDIDPRYPGFEMWNSSDGGIYAADGTRIQDKPSNMLQNFGIWWDGDPLRELLDGVGIGDWRIDLTTNTGFRVNYLSGAAGLTSNNGTKRTPSLSADLYGDWREEVIWRTTDSTALQIWSTTIAAQFRLPTLMHDVQYRSAVAWQNVGYNQPPHTSFFIGQGMATPPQPNVYAVKAARPPTVVRPASAAAVTTSAVAALAVLGSDDAGETALRYSWALVAGPGGVTFTANGTNASKATAARFTKPGSYTLRVTITDAENLTATSEVIVAYALAGDANLDWSVDLLDAANFVAAGKFNAGESADWLDGDFNQDGVVDLLDAADFIAAGRFNAGPYA